MSTNIHLNAAELNEKALKNAVEKLKSASNALSKMNTTSSYGYAGERISAGGHSYSLFTAGDLEALGSVDVTVERALNKTEALMKIMEEEPDSLEDLDSSFKKYFKNASENHVRNACSVEKTSDKGGLGKIGNWWTGLLISLGIISGPVDEETVLPDDNTINKPCDSIPKRTIINEENIFSYPEGRNVEKGTIRYVYQNGSNQEKETYGWENYANDDSGIQCNSACESMALSYLGIDRSPGSMVPEGDDLGGLEVASYANGTEVVEKQWQAPDGRTVQIHNQPFFDNEDFKNKLETFLEDGNQGNVAPPMIRYKYFDKTGGHWLIVVGKNEDGSYNVIGPGLRSERFTTVTISDDGRINGDEICGGGGIVHKYAQYSISNE